jgi:hypothetical protein
MIRETISNFVEKIAGPAAEEVGLMLQDNIKVYRMKNQLRLMDKAESILRKSGRDPKAVPYRVLLPILEKGSLEDNEQLNDKWASLLANASNGSGKYSVTPSYPNILEQISPAEAKMLDFIYSSLSTLGLDKALHFESVRKATELDEESVKIMIDNLTRLGLVVSGGSLGDENYSLEIRGYEIVGLTSLGRAFIPSCQEP